MTEFDYGVLLILGLSILLSIWRGLIREVIALTAWVAAFWAAAQFSDWVAQHLLQSLTNTTLRMTLSFGMIFFAVLFLFGFIGWLIAKAAHAIGLSWIDRTLGAFFGLARGLVLCVLAVLVLGLTSLPQQDWWLRAQLSLPLETAVIVIKPWLPTEIAKRIHFPRQTVST